MRSELFYRLLTAAFVLTLAHASCYAQLTTYNLDMAKSKLYWKGTKKVGTSHVGFILFKTGILLTDNNGKPVNGDFIIDMSSMRSTDHPEPKDNKEVDDNLKGDSFFSVKTYPTSAIKVFSIEPMATTDQYKVTGDLTIRNITQRITFTALIKPSGQRLIATADLTIDRIKFGIHERRNAGVMWSLQNAIMTDEIPIRLNLEFVKSK